MYFGAKLRLNIFMDSIWEQISGYISKGISSIDFYNGIRLNYNFLPFINWLLAIIIKMFKKSGN